MATRSEQGRQVEKWRVLLIDDHPIVRAGLARIIDDQADMLVCGEAGDADGALRAIQELGPHLVIVDLSLGGSDGLDLVKQIHTRWPDTRLLVLSMHSESLYAERTIRAGARGYVTKQQAPTQILDAIRHIRSGQVYASEEVKAMLLERIARGSRQEEPIKSLTDRELGVFQLLGHGHSTREIAGELALSVKTVDSYREQIKRKLGLRSSTELVQHAVLWLQRESGG